MNRHLVSFIDRHDGPRNLLIVYYSGPSVYHEVPKYLEFTASVQYKPLDRGRGYGAHTNWNRSEEFLRSDEVEGDVLTILDTVYASNTAEKAKTRSDDTRVFELLSACAFDPTTAPPGPNSFTRALIDALKELGEAYKGGPFTTFHLNQLIIMDPRRRDTPSMLWNILHHHDHRHIRLAPQESEEHRETQSQRPGRGYLTLRLCLRDDFLDSAQIEFLTRQLAKGLGNKPALGLRRIDWVGFRKADVFYSSVLAILAIVRWKRFVHKRLEETRLKRKVNDANLPDFF
jgi:hypothetical protein